MDRLHLITGGSEIAARRARLPGRLIETWPDLYQGGDYWVGEETKAALDSCGEPIPAKLSLDARAVPIYYGPRLVDFDSLPREDSLRARVLSAHGIAAICITVDESGERTAHTPESPLDPIFFLRRPGGAAAHVWRLFTTKNEAVAWVARWFPSDVEAAEWASALPVESFEELLARRTAPE